MIIKPKVSVCMITYGHEKYILQAIEGVLMQQCDFEVELILANDCSPDLTDQVIQDILTNHPRSSWIKYFKHEQNLGMMPNFIDALKKCEGKYVALCDGDDYWTDSLKLQKQVDFLEANEDYVMCFHQADILKINGEIVGDFITKVPKKYETLEDLAIYGNCIHTPTVVFRNVIKDFPFEFEFTPVGDYFLYMILAEKGKVKYLLNKMAIYRFESGYYSGLKKYQKFKKWNRTLILISSSTKNDNVKLILFNKLFQSFSLNDAVESKVNIKMSLKKRVFKISKLFIPPIFLIIKRKILILTNVSK